MSKGFKQHIENERHCVNNKIKSTKNKRSLVITKSISRQSAEILIITVVFGLMSLVSGSGFMIVFAIASSYGLCRLLDKIYKK